MTEKAGLLGKIIMVAILLIMGSILVGVTADQTIKNTVKTSVVNETISLAPARNGTGSLNTSYVFSVAHPATGTNLEIAECLPRATFVMKNSTGATMAATTNYVLSESGDGTFNVTNVVPLNNSVSNTTYVSYSYCQDGYITNSDWAKTILNLVAGFLALMLFGGAVVVMYMIYKDVSE